MSSHRYQYMYMPISSFLRALSPGRKALLTTAKVILITTLLIFQFVVVL